MPLKPTCAVAHQDLLEDLQHCLSFSVVSQTMACAVTSKETVVSLRERNYSKSHTDVPTAAPVSCSVGSCLYDERISWFGCCTGTMRSDCQLFTTCVGSASISSCLSNSACANDDYALACTASTAGVCMTMWGAVSEDIVNHYVCGSTSASVQVVPDPTGTGDSSATARRTSASVFSTGGSLPRPSSSRQITSSSNSNDDTVGTTPISRDTPASTSDDRPRINTAVTATTRPATTAPSTAGAMKTAQAVIGAAGGLVGVLAVLL